MFNMTSRISLEVAVPFSKEDVQLELREFMLGFARSVQRMYGPKSGGALVGHPGTSAWDVEPQDAKIEGSSLWMTVLRMYDYGIQGIRPANGIADVDGPEADAEMFFLALKGEWMKLYLEEDEVRWPKWSMRTVQTAIARMVLDGGQRYTVAGDDGAPSGYLTISEVALLADMDERSVRNAANPKLPEPLVTKNFGRRTLVDILDARRWLAGRKGFVPTKDFVPPPEPAGPDFAEVLLPYHVQSRLDHFANKASVPRWELLTQLLDQHERSLAKGEGKQ